MPKISIYVPDEMKARMDVAGQRVNWSAITQKAFECELGHVESVQEIKSMTDVIERLRASKEALAHDSKDYGRTAGQEWAKQYAEYDQLKRLARLNEGDIYNTSDDDPDWAAREIVTNTIVGDHEEAKDVLKSASGLAELYDIDEDMVDVTLTVDFLAAFVAGATEVWDEIKDKI